MEKWEANIRKVTPYVPGEQPKEPGVIKLNTNENPYPPAPGVSRALQEFESGDLRLYPDSSGKPLTEALAKRYGLCSDQVFVGVGSDDVLAMAFLTFFNSGRPILFPDVTYSFYDVWAELFGIPYERPPLKEDFSIDVMDYVRENGGIVLANPNAPTGQALDFLGVRFILEKNPSSIVILDEAYIDFGGESALSLIPEFSNLLVVQTFSKSRSLAGMRIGYALAQQSLIRYLNEVKYSFNSYTMSRAALSLGVAAMEDEAYFRSSLSKIIATRERVKRKLERLGFQLADSKTNFVFATHPCVSAEELFLTLRENKIYVRHFRQERIANYLRITIGTEEEMDALLAQLANIIMKRG